MPRKKNPNNETQVKGVRAKPKFWQAVSSVAKTENKSTNKLIVDVVENYCEKNLKKFAKSVDKQ